MHDICYSDESKPIHKYSPWMLRFPLNCNLPEDGSVITETFWRMYDIKLEVSTII